MHSLIVSCVFPPEPVVSAQTSFQIAQELLNLGHQVTVITSFPNRPAGKLFPGYSRRLYFRKTELGGLDIIRCFSFLSPHSSLISRLLENLSFGITSGWAALTMKRPDVIYSNTWPIFANGIISMVANVRGIPFIESVQDVYPESLIIQKRIYPSSFLVKILQRIDQSIALNSHSIIVISEYFRQIYHGNRKIPDNKISLIPNWLDEESIIPGEKNNFIRTSHNIPENAFLFVFGGNIGAAAGVEVVIEAFRNLVQKPDIYLLVAGEGSHLAQCQKLVKEINTGQIIIHSPWPADETSAVLSSADVLLLPTQRDQSLFSVPSKVITYMLTARPILAMAHPSSDITRFIEQSGCGWVIEPSQPLKLAKKITDILQIERQNFPGRGQAGRQYALKYLTKNANLPRIVLILEQAAIDNN